MFWRRLAAAWLALLSFGAFEVAAAPLVQLEYRIQGTTLEISPAALSVPKGIPGSILPQLKGNVSSSAVFVEAILRGPSFPARRVIGQANEPLLLPPLPLVGDYQLDNIRLVDSATGETKLEGTPSSIPIKVFDELLVSRVTSRPLTLDEIRDKGIFIDDKNFRAVEFEVGFVLEGKIIPIKFPVVAPRFEGNTEIIPAAELEARLKEADAINQDLAFSAKLPPELETGGLNIQVQGINFQPIDPDEGPDLKLSIPPIPALMVIPGNIGFLNQFFSVQIFTENAAPAGSDLRAANIVATLNLPPGPDLLLSTNFDIPGDDPLRFARVGADKSIHPTQPVVRPGADGVRGTADDIPRLFPGETGQGEFLVEGLQEGLHVMSVALVADLEGLAAGTVKIKGKAAGSVLVRNPKFSLAFSHPRTIRAGEPYEAFVTVLNTGSSVANLVQVTLPSTAISGGFLESDETVVLGTIKPGETGTAKFRLRAQRTGSISFSNLTTTDESLVGRFRLRVGLDERGVALSPDMIAMPDFATNLPPALLDAANRVLGQALSVATAPVLPPGVKPINKSFITTRVLELAEAGQRVRYHDGMNRVLVDLLLDWQGARSFNEGFDQIIRDTDAGREFRSAIFTAMEANDTVHAAARLGAQAPDIAGRGEAWLFAAANDSAANVSLKNDSDSADLEHSTIVQSAAYPGARGHLLVAPGAATGSVEWHLTNPVPNLSLSILKIAPDGTGQLFKWQFANAPAGACFTFVLANPANQLIADFNCDGTPDSLLPGDPAAIKELPPTIISAIQDLSVQAGRPSKPCFPAVPGLPPSNYGTILAVLFSKPMTQDRVNLPTAYTLDNKNVAGSVQIQPGGRIALLNMRQPFGAIIPRQVTVAEVTDPRGNIVTNATRAVESDAHSGVALHGRVARADGSPAGGIPVTLTMYDQVSGFTCDPFTVRVSQVTTDESGSFDFDFVLAGLPYSVSATDTGGLPPEAIQAILSASTENGVNRDRLLDLANSPSAQNTLLQAFAVGALPQAIAKAEALDRALLRDSIPAGSPRLGTVVPIALRFRGRATVQGQVVAADGTTPISGAAVNLFPDPDSRELGRGIFTDTGGRFSFLGVPLGSFGITADNGHGLSRTISGVMDRPGAETNILVVLTTNVVSRTALAGQVLESDNSTPHSGASVFIGKFVEGKFGNVVAIATSDSDGLWSAPSVPVNTYDIVAVSLDGKRKGERRDIAAASGVTNQVSLSLQGFGTVAGRVETPAGTPVANAIVAGGEVLVRTDQNGNFRLTGVPTGPRTISAGVERTKAGETPKSNPPFSFPRVGSAQLLVLPGVENFTIIRFEPRGSVVGKVVDETGKTLTGLNVALPEEGGFSWVPVSADGTFAFEGIALGQHTLSAPAPLVANTDVSGLLRTIGSSSSSEGEIQAAIGEAFAIFTGAADPLLNGAGATFNPASWGFTKADLTADGQVVNVTIRFLKQGTIAGTVLNSQGVPIGARVRLTGIGPARNGAPTTIIRGERNSDPAVGTFEFPREALVGDWGLQAASPFFATVVTRSGKTSDIQPNETNVVLQFPSARDQNGRLAGTVFNPDGSVASAGVKVRIRDRDFQVLTATNGTYAFGNQFNLPAVDTEGRPGVGYFVQAEDPLTGAVGAANVTILPGVTNNLAIHLLGRGALEVNVLKSDGSPASGAAVHFEQATFPQDQGQLTADSRGRVLFQNLVEGSYAALAQIVTGATTLSGRVNASVSQGGTNSVAIRLGPTGTIQGHFVKRDLLTEIAFAQIAVGEIGFATTDAEGFFRITGVPLGNYRLLSHDPVTGIGAVLNTSLSFDGQTNDVTLVEQSRGEIQGAVIGPNGVALVPGAVVTITFTDGITPPRSVTAGPDGFFSFPGAPAGAFSLVAQDPSTALRGSSSALLPENTAIFQLNVALQPLGSLNIAVFRPGGSIRATNINVTIVSDSARASADSLTSNTVQFTSLPLGTYHIVAHSLVPSENSSAGQGTITLNSAGQLSSNSVTLAGIGSISGRVVQSDGITVVSGASVQVSQRTALGDLLRTVLTDSLGRYRFDNLAVAAYQISASFGPLAATAGGTLARDGQSDTVNLTLAPSGTVIGKLVRANRVSPAVSEDTTLSFPSRNLPALLARTDPSGRFEFRNVPLGNFVLGSVAISFNGIARRAGTLVSNGQTNDLGLVIMDEDDPHVLSVAPADTSSGVPITASVNLSFNEALDPSTISSAGIFIQGPTNIVPATVDLLRDTNDLSRIVRIKPLAPLKSLTTYQVVAVDGDRKDALGSVIGSGPRDLVGRPLAAPFLSSFTTADNDPPQLLSIFPSNNAVQIDPRSVMRLSFNEPVRNTDFSFALRSPKGLVPGTASAGLNGLVLTFTPAVLLDPNTPYTLTVSNVFDLAGNRGAGEPFVSTFSSIDTLGPVITQLRIADGKAPVAGGTVLLEAVLAANESGARVRFTKDLTPLALATNAPFRIPVTLPNAGTTTIRAIATDRFGNDGEISELVVAVVSNQPPVVSLRRNLPLTGPLSAGQSFSVALSASDDLAVTNLTLTATGALSFTTNFPNGDQRTVGFVVPVNPAFGSIQFRAGAVDAFGLASVETNLTLSIADTIAPLLAILGPADNTVLDPSQPLVLTVKSSDESGHHQLSVALDGAVSAVQAGNVNAAPSASATNSFTFPIIAAIDGGDITATVRATDDAGNVSAVVQHFHIRNVHPPKLVAATPSNASLQQSLWTTISFDFDKPLDPATVTNRSVFVTNNAATALSSSVSLANGNQRIVVVLPRPLKPGVTYTNILAASIADSEGNRWQNIGGASVPNAGAPFTFTTAQIQPSTPPSGTPIVETQTLNLTANYQFGLGAAFLRLQLDAAPGVQVSAGPTSASTTLPIPVGTSSGVHNIAITASRDASFTESFAFPSIAINVRPLNGDEDGDGLPNGYEIAHAFDPFTSDAALDADGDGLSNLQEFLLGTDPRKADTDGDGLSDGAEVALGCTNPLNPDSDGDGIPDGIDPDPCNLAGGLTITAPANLNLTEGAMATLVVQVASTNSQITIFDYALGTPPPAFVSTRSRVLANTSTNGVASLELEFNPLHDAAGENLLHLRAAAANGNVAAITIKLNVADNPALLVTRWKDPVSGDWNDAAKWTAGLPAPGHVALIDAAGAYTVTLSTSASASGLVLNNHDARLALVSNPGFDCPVEVRDGTVSIDSSATLRIDRPVSNRGTLRWISGCNTFNLQGGGRLENLGLWEIFTDTLCNSQESVVRTPVNIPAGGKLLLDPNSLLLFSTGSSLNLGAQLEIQTGARLRFDGSSTAQDLTVAAGAALAGTGSIRLDGGSRMFVPGDLDNSLLIDMTSGNAQLVIPGTYIIRSSRTAVGTIKAANTIVAGNATLTLVSAALTGPMEIQSGSTLQTTGGSITFASDILVDAGARWDLPSGTTLTLNGVLTNRGTLHWISGCNTFNLQGSGRVENLGLWEIFPDTQCNSQESVIRMPVNVPRGGKLLLDTNSVLLFSTGSSLTVAGELEIQTGARLRFDGSSAAQDLTLAASAVASGIGTLRFDGGSRLFVSGNLDTTLGIEVTSGSAQLNIPGTYTVRSSRTMVGTINSAAVVVANNAELTLISAALSGPLQVQSGSALRTSGGAITFGSNVQIDSGARWDLPIGTTVSLNGVLTNRGTLRWISGCNTFNLQGNGRVENLGLWDVFPDTQCNSQESVIRMPVNVPVGGKLLLDTNSVLLFSTGSSLSVAGEVEVQTGARLRFDGSSAAQDLTVATGALLSGTGTLRFDGGSRLFVPGDLDSTLGIDVTSGSAQLNVPGTYTVRTSRTMVGTINSAAVLVSNNAELTLISAALSGPLEVQSGSALRTSGGAITFGSNVQIDSGARWDLPIGTTLTLNGVLTNRGTLRWISGCNTFNLQGNGRVENLGLWEIFPDTQCNSQESVVRMPVNIPVGGKLLLDTTSLLLFSTGSSLNVAGEVEVQTGARLRLDGSSAAQDLTIATGALLSGTGTLRFDGGSRLFVPGDLDTTLGIETTSGSAQLNIPGTYTVRSSRTIVGTVNSAAVLVANNAELTLSSATLSGPLQVQSGSALRTSGGNVTFGSNVQIDSGARWDLPIGTTLTLNGVLTNRGTLRWISGCNTFNLQGNGRVENLGLWEIFPDTQCNSQESVVRMPVNVPVGGKLLLDPTSLLLFSTGSSLSLAGELELQTGSRLRFDGSSTAQDLTVATGALLSGTGTLRFDGGSRLFVPANLDTTLGIDVTSGSAQLNVPGTYTVRSSRTMVGTINSAAVIVANNAELTLSSAALSGPLQVQGGSTLRTIGGNITFGSNVQIDSGARWELPTGTSLALNGVLTNLGTLHWISGCNVFNLQGSGRVENLGLWEIFPDTQCNSQESIIRMPVNVPVGGKLLLDTTSLLLFSTGSSLNLAGELELQSGCRLRFDGSSPSQDLALASGALLSGSGTLRFDGTSRLVLNAANTTLPFALTEMTSSSGISETTLLTIPAGSELRFDHSSTIQGSLTIDGTLRVASSGVTLTINGVLTLNPGGKIENPGIIRANSFVNNGGTINPPANSPFAVTSLASLQIQSIRLETLAAPLSKGQRASSPRQITLTWLAPEGGARLLPSTPAQYRIEISRDLRDWTEVPATPLEVSPGSYQISIPSSSAEQQFFRVFLQLSQ